MTSSQWVVNGRHASRRGAAVARVVLTKTEIAEFERMPILHLALVIMTLEDSLRLRTGHLLTRRYRSQAKMFRQTKAIGSRLTVQALSL